MTQKARKTAAKRITLDMAEMKYGLMEHKDFLAPVVQEAVQAFLEVETEERLQVDKVC